MLDFVIAQIHYFFVFETPFHVYRILTIVMLEKPEAPISPSEFSLPSYTLLTA